MDYLFELGIEVKIKVSGETGVIAGRAEYISSQNAYLLRYKNALGVAIESWWGEDALEAL